MAKTKAKQKIEPRISIGKYFQLYDPPIHRYTKAYLEIQYHGKLKIESEWKKELAKHEAVGE